MTKFVFQGYPATKRIKFTCCVCGALNRSKTLKVECTVNPFNLNEDGTMKTPDQVREQSRSKLADEERRFMAAPHCSKCPSPMTFRERVAVADLGLNP